MPKDSPPVNQLFRMLPHILDVPGFPGKIPLMNNSKTLPGLSDKGKTEADLRRQRQAEALRANLARRKVQTRARAEEETAPAADAPPLAETE